MPDHNALYQIAEQQAGYFTSAQARQAGFSSSLLSYHLDTGRFERVKPRIYRFVQFPASRHEDLHVASLRAGPEAIISHDSALALYDLSDLLPDQVHVTIPRTASRRRPGLGLHTNQLEPEDITRYEGLPVTTVLRTLADVNRAGLADEQVQQAIQEALRRGLVTRESLLGQAWSRSSRFLGRCFFKGCLLRIASQFIVELCASSNRRTRTGSHVRFGRVRARPACTFPLPAHERQVNPVLCQVKGCSHRL